VIYNHEIAYKLKNELKTDKYPNGALVYIVDYTDEQENVYRLGKTDIMKKRKLLYDTHTIYKKKVVLIKEVNCPLQFETCLRSMLYNYRIKNKKDFYECDIKKIEKAFDKCEDSIKCMSQTGGGKISNNMIFKMINYEINQLKKNKDNHMLKIDEYNKLLFV
jgi:hypothetical protein